MIAYCVTSQVPVYWPPYLMHYGICPNRLLRTHFVMGCKVAEFWFVDYSLSVKVGVNPSLNKEMWLLMHLITKKTCTKMYKSIHFWNQKNQMNPMVVTEFCKIMRFSRNSSVTMVTIVFFLESITKIWFY